MNLQPVTIEGDKVTCGSQSVEIWLSGIALCHEGFPSSGEAMRAVRRPFFSARVARVVGRFA